MKIFLTGAVGAGKTTVIRRCLENYHGPIGGFRSYKTPREGTVADIWLAEAQNPEIRHRVAHIENGRREVWPQVFDAAGTAMLKKITANTPGIVLMDEIGFLESQAPLFQKEIVRILALDIPVLGVLRTMEEPPPFLAQLHARQDITKLWVDDETRDDLPAQCRLLLGI